jgi:uroporphyrinogen decarboxylase
VTSREIVLNAVAHKDGPLPIDFGGLHASIHEQGYLAIRRHLGWEEKDPVIQDFFQMIVFPDDEMLNRFGSDIVPVYTNAPDGWKFHIVEKDNGYYFTNEWGITFRKPKDGYFFDLYESPLQRAETLSDVKKYKYTDPENPGRIRGLKEKFKKLYEETDKAVVLFCPVGGIYEHSYFLRGLTEYYIDIAGDAKIADYIAEKTCEWEVAYFGYILKEIGEYVDIVQMGDDLGGNNGLLFSKDHYYQFFKDRERRVIDAIKANTNASVYMHNCGSISEVIPDLIENGVDILNPVQVQASNMESDFLKREFGKDITFWGGGCDPRILQNGTPLEVESEVRKRIKDFSGGGGFVFASIHNIQYNMPPENIVKMFDTAMEYS